MKFYFFKLSFFQKTKIFKVFLIINYNLVICLICSVKKLKSVIKNTTSIAFYLVYYNFLCSFSFIGICYKLSSVWHAVKCTLLLFVIIRIRKQIDGLLIFLLLTCLNVDRIRPISSKCAHIYKTVWIQMQLKAISLNKLLF